MRRTRECVSRLILLWGFLASFAVDAAQESEREWEIAGVPALSFNSDEGFGYGAIVELYQYDRSGDYEPYVLTLQPTVQLSTEGRRDITLFVDGPYFFPDGWRLTAFLGSERHTATPYYGAGNDAPYDPELDRSGGSDPHYYRFGRERNGVTFDLQRPLGNSALHLLLGGGSGKVRIDPTPHDEGTTLLARDIAEGVIGPAGWTSYLRGGLVWDTRDREIGPGSGVWSELLVRSAGRALGSDHSFTTWTLTDRRYYSLRPSLVFAQRLMLRGTSGTPPFYELQQIESSFKLQEGLGGGKTLRGIPKNRYFGKGVFLWNAEVRWRADDFTAFDREFHLVLSAFVDSGRVWANGVKAGEIFSDLHSGFGGGLRLGMGESFIVAVDVGHSSESTAPIYTGLGYLF